MEEYVIIGHKTSVCKPHFLGEDDRFYEEYPEAKIFTSYDEAEKAFIKAGRNADFLVRDYGLETEEVLLTNELIY